MKQIQITAASLLLITLLCGCSEQISSSHMPEAEINSSLGSLGSDTQNNSSNTENSLAGSDNPIEMTDVSDQPISIEFTDEDREVQKILSDLKEPANEIYSWLTSYDHVTDLKFRYPDDETETHEYGLFDAFSDRFETPKTCSEMKDLMLEYFSADRTDIFLDRFAVCGAVKNFDGTYTLSSDNEQPLSPKKFVEIDGKLYRDSGVYPVAIIIDTDSIKVTHKTDDLIEFTYLNNDWTRETDNSTCLNDITLYRKYSLTGTLKYERGGWKLDKWEF